MRICTTGLERCVFRITSSPSFDCDILGLPTLAFYCVPASCCAQCRFKPTGGTYASDVPLANFPPQLPRQSVRARKTTRGRGIRMTGLSHT